MKRNNVIFLVYITDVGGLMMPWIVDVCSLQNNKDTILYSISFTLRSPLCSAVEPIRLEPFVFFIQNTFWSAVTVLNQSLDQASTWGSSSLITEWIYVHTWNKLCKNIVTLLITSGGSLLLLLYSTHIPWDWRMT
jgi:hypothetical protein